MHDERSGEVVTRVVKIPALPISFERNSDLSALSWDAVDEHLSLTDLRDRYGELIANPRMDPIFVLLTVGLANASFVVCSAGTGRPWASFSPRRSSVFPPGSGCRRMP